MTAAATVDIGPESCGVAMSRIPAFDLQDHHNEEADQDGE